jgi:hypothetical protein
MRLLALHRTKHDQLIVCGETLARHRRGHLPQDAAEAHSCAAARSCVQERRDLLKTAVTGLVGLGLGALALFVANSLLASSKPQIDTFLAALELTQKVAGFVTLAVGLGSFVFKAYDKNGISAMTVSDASGPGVLSLVGAVLLAA